MCSRIFPNSKKNIRLTLTFGFVLAFCCRSFASDVDIRPIYFKTGEPKIGGGLEKSLADRDEAMQVLAANVATLTKVDPDKFHFKIVGFTDDKECRMNACEELSLRRAKLVNAWLLSHGASVDLLNHPEGHGKNEPLNNNGTPDDRARNRRVEFQVIPNLP